MATPASGPVAQPHRPSLPTASLCPGRSDRGLPQPSLADAHLKRHGPPSEAVVVAVTNGRLDDSTELAEVFGTWERIFYSQAELLARES